MQIVGIESIEKSCICIKAGEASASVQACQGELMQIYIFMSNKSSWFVSLGWNNLNDRKMREYE